MRKIFLHPRSDQIKHKGRRSFAGFTLVELLVVIAIIGILMQMLLPAVQSARESARCLQCKNHLKNLTMAALHHESTHGFLPSGGWGSLWTGDPDLGYSKQQPGSWCYNILPYIEQGHLYQWGAGQEWDIKIDMARSRIQTPLPVFNCPSRRPCVPLPFYPNEYEAPGNFLNPTLAAKTDFAANAGDLCREVNNLGPASYDQAHEGLFEEWIKPFDLNGVIFQRSEVTIQQIFDGTSTTYMLGEKYRDMLTNFDPGDDQSLYHGHDWDTVRYTFDRYGKEVWPSRDAISSPEDDTALYANKHVGWGSRHPYTFNMSFCDGSVESIPFKINFRVHVFLANRHDGRVIDRSELE